MNVLLDVPEVHIGKVDILLDKIPYLSEIITGMTYIKDKRLVELTVNESDLDSAQISQLKESYAALCSSLMNTRVIKERVIRSNLSPNQPAANQKVRSDLKRSKYMDELDIQVSAHLDKRFILIAQQYDAELREYPTLLDKDNMTRNQYHIHFPQNVYGVASIPHDYKVINKIRITSEKVDSSLVFCGEFLQPCICYHCYEELQGRELSQGKMLTGVGKCFRHEIEWRKSKYRRSEFKMREIVFIGKEDWVVQSRISIMEDVWSFFKSLGLKGRIATATDPFYFSQDMGTKGTYQMMSNAKYELLVTTLEGKEVSLASFNFCQDTLCSKYDIKDENGTALYSGCVAFGVDRWKESLMDAYNRDWERIKESLLWRETSF
ncbi:Amino acid--[acyl-carrier-protein] ligase 1 [compost metagenome]